MKKATVNGVELEYEVKGTGEPVLLINPMLADGFLPFLSERALTDRYRLIRYHKRGWAGSTHTPPPVNIADHVVDAAALLEHLDVPRAHIAGHSSGGVIALQMALDRPEMVHTLVLLEPSFFTLPGAGAFLEQGGPALEAYAAGDHEKALAIFLTAASGLDWKTCRALLDERIPGAVAATLKDAGTVFDVELPALIRWSFSAQSAAGISQPALSVLGAETRPLWVEIAGWLRSSLPRVEECRIEGVGHLLHIQRPEPVARGIAQFLERHRMSAVLDPARDPAAIDKARAQVVELKKMLADTATARAQRQTEKPLYQRLGGREAIHAVVTDIIDLHFTEAITKPLMKGVDQQNLVRLVVEFLCRGAGGPEKYTGRDMVRAHEHLDMTAVHFMAAGDQIMRVLKKYGVPEPEQQEVLCMIVAHHDDVIR